MNAGSYDIIYYILAHCGLFRNDFPCSSECQVSRLQLRNLAT